MIWLIFLYIILGVGLILLLWKHPEICFALFLTAGLFKATPQLENVIPEFLDLTILFGTIVVLIIVINTFKKTLHIPRIPAKLFLPYIGIAALMFLSLLYTSSLTYGTEKFLKFITLTALAAFAPLFLFKNKIVLKKFLYTIISLSTAMSAIALISGKAGEAVLVFSAGYLSLAMLSGTTALIILFYAITTKKNVAKQLFWFVVLSINMVALVYSTARGPLFTLLLTAIGMLVFSFNLTRLRISKPALISVVVIVLLISLSFILFPDLTEIALRRIKYTPFATGGIKPIQERLAMFSTALQGLYLHPVAGLGVGGFRAFSYNIKGWQYPHNILLETGAELGFLGFTLLTLLIGFCFFHLLRLRKKYKSKEEKVLIALILALFIYGLLNSMISGEINEVRLFFTWIGTAYVLNNIFKLKRLKLLKT